ncbi:MAG: arsenate reductase ArsC [Thermodesulfobacteriota bacterium]
MKKKVLFICTHNSARSQMAEGLLNHLYGSKYEAYSAGTKPSIVNPYAVTALAEIGIDISRNRSKGIEEFQGMKFDYVVTVCDNAKETCPFFPGGREYLHKSFDDPSGVDGEDDVKLITFRNTRDEIRDWIEETFEL